MYKGEGMKTSAISFKGLEVTKAKSGDILPKPTMPTVDIKKMNQIALIKSEDLAGAVIIPVRYKGHHVRLTGKDGSTIISNPKFVSSTVNKAGEVISWSVNNHPKQNGAVVVKMIDLHSQLLTKAQEFLSHCRK